MNKCIQLLKHRPLARSRQQKQQGAAMVEFVVVGPLITVLGLAILQYSLMFFAKGQINHAAFMAARAGSVAHATFDTIESAYKRALIPLYGGGENTQELLASYAKVVADLTPQVLRVEVLNPTKESFDDFAKDAKLNEFFGARAIPNLGIGLAAGLDVVGPTSGQTLQDANLLKLRITHGYEPKVWLLGMIHSKYLAWTDTGSDSFATQLIMSGRIPVVTHVTVEMHSEAVEQKNANGKNIFASSPGQGNNGQAVNPGDPAANIKPEPVCLTMRCSLAPTPSDPGSNGSSGGGTNNGSGFCAGANCPICNG
jgi:hypothetical protein